MSRFPDTLHLRDGGMKRGSRVFILEKSFRYIFKEKTISVPARFPTDGASVPRIFWPLFDPFGPYFGAAVVHDYLYSPLNRTFTRQECDLIFLQAMKDAGVNWLARNLIYRCVRLAGWWFYRGRAF